jgi:glycosyltransferase involved in cell wall biosynthesis
MEINAVDLEVFILTYNRADYLQQTLISLINQTVKEFRIVVLDNGSTDGTPQLVKSFESYGVELNRSERNLGGLNNFNRARHLANRQWVMAFHDDDLLHPSYIEFALKLIAKYPNLVMLGTAMSFERNPQNSKWAPLKGNFIKCKNARKFASLLYSGFSFHFGATIYRTELFKNCFFNWEEYGKIGDRPFLLDIAQHGPVLVFEEPFVKYRCHAGQDSGDSASGPFIPQLIALHRNYLRLLGSNPFSHEGRIFIANNYKYLYVEYTQLHERNKLMGRNYIQKAFQEGASTPMAIGYGALVQSYKNLRSGVRKLIKDK